MPDMVVTEDGFLCVPLTSQWPRLFDGIWDTKPHNICNNRPRYDFLYSS